MLYIDQSIGFQIHDFLFQINYKNKISIQSLHLFMHPL